LLINQKDQHHIKFPIEGVFMLAEATKDHEGVCGAFEGLIVVREEGQLDNLTCVATANLVLTKSKIADTELTMELLYPR
jgi:hypothetical protein